MEQRFMGVHSPRHKTNGISARQAEQLKPSLFIPFHYSGFMKRHPNLSLRTPEATSASRARGFNRSNVGEFFRLLEELMEKHKFGAGVLQQELSEAENLEPSEAENMDVSDTCTDKPGTSSADSESEEYALASPNFVGPVQMFKYPKATERKKPSKRSGKTAILTSSPYKNGLCTPATKTSHVNGTISKDEESKSTDSEDEECIVDLDDSGESESFDEMMETERKEREELEDLIQQDTFKKGDYILVRFSRKKMCTLLCH